MLKIIVTAKGAFTDISVKPIQSHVVGRPFLIQATAFAQTCLQRGALTEIDRLPEGCDATDAEWEKWFNDHDKDVKTAIENYRKHLLNQVEDAEVEDKKPSKKDKKNKD